ncbi:hypothetical protein PSU4_33140 [Pseudonocardia sulfidoxydans NBRC 16205]|uniref:DUF559 domain-containing protein n=1 Tax=Pseudonocardia sulfidoxydans NBRC 16205 TaxID=1223511 RepID=A0A511DHU3_9PSEU|nr:DUF559 domain-containing protein [Pseudonocardia sulfidoxydans]GEL24360.1 hypothetical protein PSU4_33140 [Pseudonocardia sulfidoxydans NBRC 16205]
MLQQPFRGSTAIATGLVTPGRLRGRDFIRLAPDVYVAAGTEPDLSTRSVAAYRRVEDVGGVIGGWSAATLLGAPGAHRGADAVVVVPRYVKPVPGVRVGRWRLLPEEVTVVGGCRVTTPLRTAWDIARREARADAVVAIDSLARNAGLPLEALADMAFRLRNVRGAALVRTAVSLADPRAESPMETRVRLVLTDAGLPAPVSQYELVVDGRVVARFDLAYPDARLAIEYDGADHDDVLDRQRDVRTGALGWQTIRLVSADIFQTPEETAASVRAVLRRRLLLHAGP